MLENMLICNKCFIPIYPSNNRCPGTSVICHEKSHLRPINVNGTFHDILRTSRDIALLLGYRGKRPFHITQCGHISCQTCLQQVEKQCPQCGRVGTISLALEEPLIPKLASYFQPFSETLEMLLKVETFRTNQMKIVMQRFHDLDKKYEVLKTRYWLEQHNMKVSMEKYMKLKSDADKLNKKLQRFRMLRGSSQSMFHMMGQTPSDSGISSMLSTRYSMESELVRSANATPMSDSKTQYETVDGFRIPANRKLPKTMGSRNMLS